jgi:hypothetical protein
VFFEDGGVAPAARPVELGDQRRVVFDADLVDAVFIAVQRQQAAVAAQADAVEGVEHAVGAQRGIRVGSIHKRHCKRRGVYTVGFPK